MCVSRFKCVRGVVDTLSVEKHTHTHDGERAVKKNMHDVTLCADDDVAAAAAASFAQICCCSIVLIVVAYRRLHTPAPATRRRLYNGLCLALLCSHNMIVLCARCSRYVCSERTVRCGTASPYQSARPTATRHTRGFVVEWQTYLLLRSSRRRRRYTTPLRRRRVGVAA